MIYSKVIQLHMCVCVCARVCVLSYPVVFNFSTTWTVACQAPLSWGFPRQKYCSGFPPPPPGDLSQPGIEPTYLVLASRFFIIELPGKHTHTHIYILFQILFHYTL